MKATWMDTRPGTRVVVAMSGGVDSSVAAALLVERGCDVIGITMKNFCYAEVPEEHAAAACCSLEAIESARSAARTIGIPHHVLDFEGPFRSAVIDPFVDEYAAGRTPNPCVRCNRLVRFPHLWSKARLLGAEYVATGHYARAIRGPDGVRLLRPRDLAKDQTYYLWGLGRSLLERALFPLGDMRKREVRSRARDLGLDSAERPESQDICFIPDGNLRDFLESERADRPAVAAERFAPGPVVSTTGESLGTHSGSAFFTVGQRRGLGIARGRPLYVTAIKSPNTLVVGDEADLYSDGLDAEDLNWLVDPTPGETLCAAAQIRYRSPAVAAVVTPGPGRTARIRFEAPLRAIGPGQSVALYEGDRLLGGGTIARAS